MIKTLLTILNLPNIGTVKAKKIIPLLEEDYSNINIKNKIKIILNQDFSEIEMKASESAAEKIIDLCYKNKINILYGNQIPKILSQYSDSPLVIYSKGNEIINKEKNIAIIGTRTPSKEGKKAAEQVSSLICKSQYNILSGLALGIDTIAHLTSVINNKRTIGVIGSGLLNIYPKENNKLAEEIINNNGCIISPYNPNSLVQNFQLVFRDKIQARLSEKVILIESKVDGGSMHAISEAIKIGTPIYAIDYENDNQFNQSGNRKILNEKNSEQIRYKNIETDIEKINQEYKNTLF